MTTPIIADVQPHHFSISVPNMAEAIKFWTDVFGAKVEFQFHVAALGGNGAFLQVGALKLELWELAGAAPVPEERKMPNSDLKTCGTKHMAFSVPDLQTTLETLFRAGVKIAAVQRHRGLPMQEEADPTLAFDPTRKPAFAAFIQDPAGTLIEILNRPEV